MEERQCGANYPTANYPYTPEARRKHSQSRPNTGPNTYQIASSASTCFCGLERGGLRPEGDASHQTPLVACPRPLPRTVKTPTASGAWGDDVCHPPDLLGRIPAQCLTHISAQCSSQRLPQRRGAGGTTRVLVNMFTRCTLDKGVSCAWVGGIGRRAEHRKSQAPPSHLPTTADEWPKQHQTGHMAAGNGQPACKSCTSKTNPLPSVIVCKHPR